MGEELFKQLIDNFGRMCGQVPDNRRPGHNERYRIADIVKSAFGVFFFQHRSMPDYQRKMKEKQGRNNPETVFGVRALPSDSWATSAGRQGAICWSGEASLLALVGMGDWRKMGTRSFGWFVIR